MFSADDIIIIEFFTSFCLTLPYPSHGAFNIIPPKRDRKSGRKEGMKKEKKNIVGLKGRHLSVVSAEDLNVGIKIIIMI